MAFRAPLKDDFNILGPALGPHELSKLPICLRPERLDRSASVMHSVSFYVNA